MKQIAEFNHPPGHNAIVLMCVIRDEELLLPAFVAHYQSLGVSHFVFVDNGSNDNSVNYLQNLTDAPVQLWEATNSYADNDFGMNWINQLLKSRFRHAWCVVVDSDEFLVPRQGSLVKLRSDMLRQGHNVAQCILVDFYPNAIDPDPQPLREQFDPFKHSPHYDGFVDENHYYQDQSGDGSFVLKGGMRHRVYVEGVANLNSVCLNKKSFFYNDFSESLRLSAGMHWLFPNDSRNWNRAEQERSRQWISYTEDISLIAHFKFVRPNLREFFRQRVERNQDWDNSREYRNYLENFRVSFHCPGVSRKFSNARALYGDTIDSLKDITTR